MNIHIQKINFASTRNPGSPFLHPKIQFFNLSFPNVWPESRTFGRNFKRRRFGRNRAGLAGFFGKNLEKYFWPFLVAFWSYLISWTPDYEYSYGHVYFVVVPKTHGPRRWSPSIAWKLRWSRNCRKLDEIEHRGHQVEDPDSKINIPGSKYSRKAEKNRKWPSIF